MQGVGFRWWCKQAASALGIRGSVRNLSDGGVEVIAAGSAEGLERFDDQLRSGPAMARIDLVEVRILAPSADHPADDGEFVILP